MAEFCLECWNEMRGVNDPASKYIFSKGLYLCEGCGKMKSVVIIERKYYYRRKFRYIIIPITIICKLVCLPYLIYRFAKTHKERKAYYAELERQKALTEQEMKETFEKLLQEALEEYDFDE